MLKQRIITAVVAGLVVVFVLLFGGAIYWKWLVWACTMGAFIEFATMNQARWYGGLTAFGAALVTIIEWFPHLFYHPFMLYLLIASVLAVPVLSLNRVGIKMMALQMVGALYIAAGGYSLSGLRELPLGWFWLWLFLISIWMSDTAAYFVGRSFKGPKLIPDISPKKTISGSVGGAIGAAFGALVFGLLAHPVNQDWLYALTGVLISVAGQLGDLIESAYKRSAGVKDSGKLLPGHGGMLDRIDSLLFAAPFALWFISHGVAMWVR